ncbi:glycosyltransferase [Bacillus sp. N9]
MKLQVLVSTMNQTDFSLLKEMNIQSDAIVVNQCKINNFDVVNYNGHKVRFLSLNEKGVGLSRNTALMRSEGDICVLADDDLTYVDGYKDIILKEFNDNPQADIILFNVPSTNKDRPSYIIPKISRVRWYNSLKYGAVNIAFRSESVKKANVSFSLLFGGGARYSAGEDSLFIADCLRKGLKIYTNPKIIGFVKQDESTWFEGYTDKFLLIKAYFLQVYRSGGQRLYVYSLW